MWGRVHNRTGDHGGKPIRLGVAVGAPSVHPSRRTGGLHVPIQLRAFRFSAWMTTTRTHFTFRVDTWTPDGESIVEHIAGVEDYQVALATYRAACEHWPSTPITLRQGA